MRLYHYVGPAAIRERTASAAGGIILDSAQRVADWIKQSGQIADRAGLIAATFVVDGQGLLRIADRRSEHVGCAAGGPVLSAGEIFFRLLGSRFEVAEVTNQSTGFCPEPESWSAVAAALDRIGIPHPRRFTDEIVFRRCPACGERNVVKDGWFICGVCEAELPAVWNF